MRAIYITDDEEELLADALERLWSVVPERRDEIERASNSLRLGWAHRTLYYGVEVEQ